MSRAETIAQGVTLYPGDCMAVLAEFGENCVDACVTDPPYHLHSTGGGSRSVNKANRGQTSSPYAARSGFMGQKWDGGEIAFEPETWAAVYRVLKPGGHLLAFGAPKNFGFMQVAMAKAGFEIRDVIAWIFGSGFPKSHNLEGGFGTALKPAYEPVIMARKPPIGTVADNFEKHGTGGLNIGACRIGTEKHVIRGGRGGDVAPWQLVRIDEERTGRFPANVIHDGSTEVVEAFPADNKQATGLPKVSAGTKANPGWAETKGMNTPGRTNIGVRDHGDAGSAARFFYTAKADADDRLGSKHPTVKPLDLMQYLVRLVTPPKGLVLDLFAGTGTTGEAAIREGMRAILIEREPEYQDDIRRRMKLAMAGPDERSRESIKAKLKDVPPDHGPLFAFDDYDAAKDLEGSINDCYRAIKERQAAGGPGWEPPALKTAEGTE